MGDGTVTVIDSDSDTVLTTIDVGTSPSGIWVDTVANLVYVTNQGSNTVSVINGRTNEVIATIPVGTLPIDIVGNPATNRLYVVNQGGGSVSVIQATTGSVVATIPVGVGPAAVTIDTSANILYVANQGSNTISVINGFSNVEVATINVGSEPTGIALNRNTKRLYAANYGRNTISVIDTTTHKVSATVSSGAGPRRVAVFERINLVYVTNHDSNNVTVIDGETNGVLGTLAAGERPTSVAVDSAGTRLYVVNTGSGSLSAIAIVALKSPAPQAPVDGTVLQTPGTTLAWAEVPGATQYHLQVIPYNNDGPGINIIRNIESSYTIQPPLRGIGNYVLLPGMSYSWRVRVTYAGTAIAEDSILWGPWSRSASFRTPAPRTSSITLVQPAPGAYVQSPLPILRWADNDANIFYYEVQVSKDPQFGNNAFLYWELRHGGITQPTNSYTIPAAYPLEADTVYYWRVRPRVQGDGIPVAWTQPAAFRTP